MADILLDVQSAPATPAAGQGVVYVDSTSKNLAVKDDAGTVKHGAQTEAGAASNFLTALNDAGAFSKAQPTDADLSLSDITTNNVSITKHGFAPKAPNDATKYLDGTGAYSVPASGSGHTIRENGVDQTARTGLNFIDADAGAGLITDDAGGNETEVNLSLYRLEAQDHNHQSTGLQAGQLDHGLALTGLTDDDHTQYLKEEASGGLASEVPDHTHASAAEAGSSLSPATLVIPGAASPAQTAEGSAVWDTDDDVLTIGDGTSRKTFGKLGSTNAAAIGTAAAGSSVEASRVDHVHPTGAGTPSTQAFGDSAVVGTGPAASMTDHKHAMPANPVSANSLIRTITFVIDGGGSTITTGVKGDLEIPFACTINRVTLLADQSGSIVIDIWKDTYANYPPTVADTITAAAKPTITTATKSQDATLTGWTTSITAGDTLRFNVDSVTTIQRVTLSLKVTVS